MRNVLRLLIFLVPLLLGCSAPTQRNQLIQEAEHTPGRQRISDRALKDIDDALNSENPVMRAVAVDGLAKMDDEHAISRLRKVFEEDPVEQVRVIAAYGLARFGHQDALEFLINAAVKSRYKSAADYLKYIGSVAVEPLIDELKGKEPTARCIAAEILGKIGDSKAAGPLIKALKDKNWRVRSHAAESLGKIPREEAIEPLIEASRDKVAHVRSSAVQALGEINSKKAIGAIIDRLKDEDKSVRFFATWELQGVRDKRAVLPLIEALKDKDRCVRHTAAQALANISDKRAVGPMIEALKDQEVHVRVRVADALKELTGQDFRTDYQKWKEWYEKNKSE